MENQPHSQAAAAWQPGRPAEDGVDLVEIFYLLWGQGRQILAWKPDALIPVPLHKKRLEKRGYNQAALLAGQIGDRLRIPVLSDWIIREKNTAPLKQLDAAERQNNLKKAFKIRRDDVKLSTIVIIDDIYTTGSTVDEIAAECRKKGVHTVCFAALSAGSRPDR